MNAWQRLLATSSLVMGTAWDLITHPILQLGNGFYNSTILTSSTKENIIKEYTEPYNILSSEVYIPIESLSTTQVLRDNITSSIIHLINDTNAANVVHTTSISQVIRD